MMLFEKNQMDVTDNREVNHRTAHRDMTQTPETTFRALVLPSIERRVS